MGSIHTRSLLVSLAVALSLALIGCGPPWRVRFASGPPSALATVQSIGVSLDYSQLMMGGQPEAQWLATQPPDDQASYVDARAATEQAFMEELAREMAPIPVQRMTGAESHVLVVSPTFLEMGFYRFIMNRPTEMRAILTFVMAQQPTDEIEVRATEDATAMQPAIITRMQRCGQYFARLTSRYVRDAQRAR